MTDPTTDPTEGTDPVDGVVLADGSVVTQTDTGVKRVAPNGSEWDVPLTATQTRNVLGHVNTMRALGII